MAFTIKKGDTLPEINASLTTGPDADTQVAVDLTTATSTILVIKPVAGGSSTRLTGAIVGSPTLGNVKYVWQAGDTSVAGSYDAEWEITFGAGKIQTFPNDSYFSIIISSDLG